jgi:hypothetical protein
MRRGEKFEVPEDVRMLTGGTNIKSEVLPPRLVLLLRCLLDAGSSNLGQFR